MKLVLDTNSYHPARLDDVRASKTVALINKATEGTSYQDKTLSNARTVAELAKIPFGSYVFLRPSSKGSEAKFYLDYARPRRGDIEPIIDAEDMSVGISALAKRTQSCAKALEAEGYKPILYASSSIWQEMIALEPSLKRLRVWEAQYPGRFSRWLPRLAALRVKLRHGVTVVLWQWTDAYAVNGRRYDASALLVDVESILIPSAAPAASGGARRPL